MKHLLFFDGECPLCQRSIRFVLRTDRKKHFGFASLSSKRAKRDLGDHLDQFLERDTLILLQDYGTLSEKLFIEGKGALRVLWLLGGWYRLLGWMSYLPGFLFGWGYRLIAKNRYKLFKTKKPLKNNAFKGRFYS
ncbi:MAG: DUF393 domain-containing protein [Chlamydiia bacterium]|nr:DUF393 domain-containing protein [Chlamydiia bacterium]